MRCVFGIFLLVTSTQVLSQVKLSIFDTEMTLHGDCTYYSNDVINSGFICLSDTESYTIKVQSPSQVDSLFKDMIKEDNLATFPQTLLGLKYYYTSESVDDDKTYRYAICDDKACIYLISQSYSHIYSLLTQLGIALILDIRALMESEIIPDDP